MNRATVKCARRIPSGTVLSALEAINHLCFLTLYVISALDSDHDDGDNDNVCRVLRVHRSWILAQCISHSSPFYSHKAAEMQVLLIVSVCGWGN